MQQPIEVFWTPAPFRSVDTQFNFEYDAPVPVLSPFGKGSTSREIFKCPAVKDRAKNLYAFRSIAGDHHKFKPGELAEYSNSPDLNFHFRGEGGRLNFIKIRETAIKDFINVNYNVSWILRASEPLVAKFTAPYFPAASPAKGSYLATGEFDIGQWFRQFNLDYFLPIGTTDFIIEPDDPLFFLELKTDRKIRFRRFIPTPELNALALEHADSATNHPKSSWHFRYEMAKRTKMDKIVDKLIREAVVE